MKMQTKLIGSAALAVATAIFGASAADAATVINFSNYVSSSTIQQASLQSGGFDFFYSVNTPSTTYATFVVWPVASPYNAAPAGEATILADSEAYPGVMALSRIGVFSITSVEIADANDGYFGYLGSEPERIDFTGQEAGGGTVTASATISHATVGLTLVDLTGFNDLMSLSWTGTVGGVSLHSERFQLTDFNISYIYVPEPSTWAMMLLGVGWLGAGLRMGGRKGPLGRAAG